MARLATAFVLVMALLVPTMAFGSECITINGKKYCEQTTQITLGGVKLNVKDPAELLRKAKQTKGTLKRTASLYTDYHYLPVIVELAKQNDKTYDEFIQYMIIHWSAEEPNPFATIYDFEMIYDDIPTEYKATVISGIANKVAHDVEEAIHAVFYIGEENV